MPRIHVHVPYASFFKYVDVFRRHRLSIELYLGTESIDDITADDMRAIKDALDWEHTVSVHGPFMDLSPGAIDRTIAEASLRRYLQVIELSSILGPEVVVFHSGYEKWKYAGEVELWMKPSVKTWKRVMQDAGKAGMKVAVENIVDAEPGHLKRLAEEVGHPMFGLCLDVGHREIFSELTVTDWVDGFHPHIFELHLHDNSGTFDDHLPIGEGVVDFAALFSRIKDLGIDPVMTLEAHSAEDAVNSLENLKSLL